MPERELAGLARRGRHDHSIVRDLLDPPGRGTERDDLADPALVDHLLVELAHPPAGRARIADQEDAVLATVRDRPAARDGHDPRVATSLHDPRDAVPREPGLELGELVGWIGPGQHRQDALERLAPEGLVGHCSGDGRVQVVDGPALHDGHRHHLLGEHVERIARHGRGLDCPGVHAFGHDGRLEQVSAVLGEDDSARGRIDLVSGPPDPLQPSGDRRRRFDLDHQVDRAHVDAQLEARGGHDRRQAAVLERLLDRHPLLPGDRAVVGPHELLAGQLVEPLGEALGETPAVAEDDRRAMGPDQLEDPWMDRRPDADPRLGSRCRAAGLLLERQRLTETAHVLDRHDDRELERLARARIDDPDLAAGPGAAEEAGDRVERTLRRREPDPLEPRCIGGAQRLEPFEAERQVGAPFGPGNGVDLIDDHVLNGAQALARLARQEEIQRLGGGDQDVGRATRQEAALLGARVAGAQPDGDRRHGIAASPGGQRDPGQRRPEVPLDVVRERLERRDVEDPDRARPLPTGWRGGRPDEVVEAPQERGQGLAAPGGSMDQGVLARGDGSPALCLRGGWRRERGGEPVANRRAEDSEGVADAGRGRSVRSGAVSGRREAGGRGAVSGRSVPRGGWRSGRSSGGHGTPSIGPTVHFEQLIEMV